MKIDDGRTPIYLHHRDNGAVVLMQGPSHIRLSSREVDLLVRALVQDPRPRTCAEYADKAAVNVVAQHL